MKGPVRIKMLGSLNELKGNPYIWSIVRKRGRKKQDENGETLFIQNLFQKTWLWTGYTSPFYSPLLYEFSSLKIASMPMALNITYMSDFPHYISYFKRYLINLTNTNFSGHILCI
jgi:hypothetical protein